MAYNKGKKILTGFYLNSRQPIDTRLAVDTLAERNKLITDRVAYDGLQVYVRETKELYLLIDYLKSTWYTIGARPNPTTYVREFDTMNNVNEKLDIFRVGNTNLWYFQVTKAEHQLTSPYVANVLAKMPSVESAQDIGETYSNILVDTEVYSSGLVKVYFNSTATSNPQIKGKLILKGV